MINLDKSRVGVTELLLTRAPDDKTLFTLEGYGELRVGGYFGGAGATITVGGVTWQCRREKTLSSKLVMVDPTGQVHARYQRPLFSIKRGTIDLDGQTFGMAGQGSSRPHFDLRAGSTDLARLNGKSGGSTPVRVLIPHGSQLPPLLLMFAVYVTREAARHVGNGSSDGGGGFDAGGGCSGGSDGGGGGCGGGGCGGGS